MMNKKRLAVVALLVFCCVGMVFAQGAREALAERGQKVVMTPNGFSIQQIVAEAAAPVAEVAPVVEAAPAAKPCLEKKVAYEVVGYKYLFVLEGNKVSLKYIDMYGDAEVAYIGKVLMEAIPGAKDCKNPLPGTLEITAEENVEEAAFDAVVEKVEAIIYHNFF